MSALSLGELFVRLSLRNQEFTQNLSAAKGAVQQFGTQVAAAGAKVAALGSGAAASAASAVSRGLSAASKSAAEFGQRVMAVSAKARALASAGLSSLGSKLTSGLQGAAKGLEGFGKKVNEVGSKLGGLGVAGLAMLGGFVAKAAEVDPGVAKSVTDLQASFRAMAVEVAKTVQPAMAFLADAVGKLAGFFRSLSPETKALVGNIAAFGSGALVAVGAASKLVGAVTALAPLAGVIAPLLVPLAGIALAIGAVIIIAGALREAWDTNFLGIQETAAAVWDWLLGATKKVADFFKGVWEKVSEWALIAFKAIAEHFATVIRVMASFARRAGLDKIADGLDSVAGFAEKLSMASSVGEMFGDIKQVGLDVFTFIARGAKKNLDDVLDGVKAKLAALKKEWNTADSLRVAAPNKEGNGVKALELKPSRKLSETPGSALHSAQSLTGRSTLELKAALSGAANAARTFSGQLASTAQQLGRALMNKLPSDVGGAVNAGIQGAAVGGPVGAAAGVVLEVASSGKAFQEAMSVASGIFKTLADAIGPMFQPLGKVVASIGLVLEAVVSAFQPVFDFIAGLLDVVAPVFVLIANVIEAFSPILNLVLSVLTPVLKLLGVAFKGLFIAVKYLGLGVLYVVRAIAYVWDAMVAAVIWVLKILDKIPLVDLGDTIRKMEKWKFGDDIDRSIDKLSKVNWTSADAAAEKAKNDYIAADAAGGAADAMNSLADANLPSWYKPDLARYKASDFMAPSGAAAAGAIAGSVDRVQNVVQTNSNNTTVNVNTQASDAKEVAKQVQKEIERERVRKRGTTALRQSAW